MHIVFRQNLGQTDCNKYGLEHKKCQIGMEADISKETGEALLAAGIAVDRKDADEDELLISWREEQAKKAAAVAAVAKPAEVKAPAHTPKHEK